MKKLVQAAKELGEEIADAVTRDGTEVSPVDEPKEEPKRLRFVGIGVHHWGNGATYEECIENLKESGGGGRVKALIWMWVGEGEDLPTKAYASDFGGLTWEGTNARPILIQDLRPAEMKREHPVEIGSVW
jgi:hypothetical protein